jgi:hypothetical protein
MSGPAQPLAPPQGPAQAAPGPYREQLPPVSSEKGLFGALVDINFDYLVTPKLIKVFYVLAMMMISLFALVIVLIGIEVAGLRNGWFLGLVIMLSSPFVWLFQALLVRIFMEAIIVRFKTVEQLRIIKDKL